MRRIALLLSLLTILSGSPRAQGWPQDFSGVILQAFSADSFDDSRWSVLTAQAEQLARTFSIVLVPNSAAARDNDPFGFEPVYWMTNHNTVFGSEEQLAEMIAAFKAHGISTLAHVELNHRLGISGLTDFPAEQWNGRTWHLGPEHVCRDDREGSGAYDTGTNHPDASDLDHTNPAVREHCVAYLNSLLERGYDGFSFASARGFHVRYVKDYVRQSSPTFALSYYDDSDHEMVRAWMEGVEYESAALDHPFKNALTRALEQKDMRLLMWDDTRPAGLIGLMSRYAVTFVDNHITALDSRCLNRDTEAAYALLLSMPGTPCVFLPHWLEHREAIADMAALRRAVGVTNTSGIELLRLSSGCFMAKVFGTEGELVVRIGSENFRPTGYSDEDCLLAGKNYAIWTRVAVEGLTGTPREPAPTIYLSNTADWECPTVWAWRDGIGPVTANPERPGDAMVEEGDRFRWSLPEGKEAPDYITFSDNGYDSSFDTPFHNLGLYDCEGTLLAVDGRPYFPREMFIVGLDLPYLPDSQTADGFYRWSEVTIPEGAEFNFTTAPGGTIYDMREDYGPSTNGIPAQHGIPTSVSRYRYFDTDAPCWTAAPGEYAVELNLRDLQLTLTDLNASMQSVEHTLVTPTYFTLEGIQTATPEPGRIYIVRRGSEVTKEVRGQNR